MKARSATSRKSRGAREVLVEAPPAPLPLPAGSGEKWAEAIVWALILAVPLLLVPNAKEAFRLPKLLVAEWLGLASLLPLAWDARSALGSLLRRPVVRAAVPLVLAAGLGLFFTRYPLQLRSAWFDLAIGAACLIGWSLGFSRERLERLLAGLAIPAAILALFGILQAHNLYQPLGFAGITATDRLSMTSTAGNPGDLGVYLVLPCLAAGWFVLRTGSVLLRGAMLAALGLSLYALALTQTLAALAALAAGGFLLAWRLLPRRKLLLGLGAGLTAAVVLVAAVQPLRQRVGAKLAQATGGEWNEVLTGRLDGWRAAVEMFGEQPVWGVGHGVFLSEFVPAKLRLVEKGVKFYEKQTNVVFANAHNEFLEVAADSGLIGLAALGWGIAVLIGVLRRMLRTGERRDGAFALAGVAALAVLSLAQFPFRIALAAFPALLFLAWVFRRGEEPA
jgi:O-antigen ligase